MSLDVMRRLECLLVVAGCGLARGCVQWETPLYLLVVSCDAAL